MLKLSARVGAAVVVRHPSPMMQAAMNFFIFSSFGLAAGLAVSVKVGRGK
jgi:hypothetical protein